MPFVRFSRDRRGYEHLYLVDAKEHGRSRVIYWFRTPPGVKVGRNPFDAATQRSLEQQYPDVKFDWPQIVAARIPPPTPVENWREKRRAERAFKRARAEQTVEVAELERLNAEPLSSETEGPAPEEDRRGGELDGGEVDGGEMDGGEMDGKVEESAQIVPAAEASASNSVSGTRRRRRRRRRGRRPDTPADTAAPPSDPDGPLDPADSLEKPSNEG